MAIPSRRSSVTDHPNAAARFDRAYRALAHPVRRVVVAHQRETGATVTTVDALAGYLAASFDALDEARAETLLRHVHLPKLRELGVVEYDERSGAVRYSVPDAVDAVFASAAGGGWKADGGQEVA